MCVICVSTVAIVSLLAPTQGPTIVEKKNIQQQQTTNKSCSKSNLNKTIKLPNKKVLLCTKYGEGYYNVGYKWIEKTPVKKQPQLPTTSEQKLDIPTQSTSVNGVYPNIINSFKHQSNYFKLAVITSPKVDKEKVSEIVSKYEKSVNFFPMPIDKKITWVFVSESEKDWWIQKSTEIDLNLNLQWWDSGRCQISKATLCAYGNGNPNLPIFYMVVGSDYQWTTNDEIIADHESAHMYQMVSWANSYLKCWVLEGHANAIGMAMSSRINDLNSYRQSQIRDIQRMFIDYKTFSVEDWVNAYNKINSDRDFCFKNGAGYSMGMLAVESMYELYDGKLVDQFFTEYSNSRNFNESLVKYFNVNELEFYKNVAKYAKKSV
jgi:hypothetical protein